MNMNLNLDDEDEEEDDDEDGAGNGDGDGNDEGEVEKEETEVFADEANNDVSVAAAAAAATTTASIFNTDNEVLDHEQDEDTLLMMQPGDILSRLLHKRPQKKKTGGGAGAGATATVGLTSDGNEAGTATAAAMADTGVRFVAPARNGHRRTRANNQHKKHKSPKGLALSTLLCEGYNIEQRNCNSFECSGKCNEPFNANNG